MCLNPVSCGFCQDAKFWPCVCVSAGFREGRGWTGGAGQEVNAAYGRGIESAEEQLSR